MEKTGITRCFKMVKILDTTLREGEQTAGIKFSVEQKIEIARKLDKFGVDYIEAGMPIISEYDKKCVVAVANLGLKAEILGHTRAKKEDIDAVAETGCKWVGIFCGINDLSRKYKLNNRTKKEVYAMIEESIKYAKSKGLKVRYTVEDATRTPIKDLIEIAKLAKKAGADRFSVADTVGCAIPESMFKLILTLKNEVDIELEAHCHNDFGLALANSLAAYRAGADVIDVTVNGLGERAGLTSLAEFCLALKKLYNFNKSGYTILPELNKLVEKYSAVHLDSLRPIVGKNAFTHTAKLHRLAVEQNPSCYESISPGFVGRKREVYEESKGKNYLKLINTPLIKRASELRMHKDGQGIRYVFMDERIIPETSMYAIVRDIQNATQDKQSHVEMHRHNCDSVFIFIGNGNNLEGLTCEVTLGNEKYIISSPTSVFIPQGLEHTYRLISGSGKYINIVLSGDYNKSLF